ncbi:acyl-CoA synthetase [Nocardia huaxiensis]|uniref:acyl-CoA synthetase n=1 Tax=Nocardia huaxiensis TaxID=2755382 RepID=UPI001E57C58F|nr:acyl-CoA synthetase [Nocardia huaxiensis]UFS98553.1 acyl-CoA synthetase [Nocardia huaxiensis]
MTPARFPASASMVGRITDELCYLRALAHGGLLRPESPRRIRASAAAVRRFGMLGGVVGVAAARFPNRVGLIDELGSLTFRELDERSNALANAWRNRGLPPGAGVAVLARNHRGLVDAVFAAAKCGARIILLNTDFAAPQLREVVAREGVDLLVHDDEYGPLLDGLEPRYGRFLAWTKTAGADTLGALIVSAPVTPPPAPGVVPKVVLLTSGTTGTPKGATRPEPRSLSPIGALLDRVPFRSGEVTVVAVPMFHTLGFAHLALAVALGSTLVVRRRFDPAATLEALTRHRGTALIAVPVMVSRILEQLAAENHAPDLSALRIVYVAGSQLGPDLARRALAALGPVVYNMYGSTEVAYAAIATPADLEAEPGSVGKPVRGTVVRILDAQGRQVPAGQTGSIFVGNPFQSQGYTGGGHKQIVDGLMASGDVGHFDSAGRLFIDGRDDDMIVSGGENVFPGEVEDLLSAHPAVREAACLGVPDERYGQRLRAYVVTHDSGTLTEDDLRDYVKANLARYKVPRDVVFLAALPRNPTGKVLKRELREPVSDAGSTPASH